MILIPAYNLNAKLATKYEAQIVAAIHRHRSAELEAIKETVSPRTSVQARRTSVTTDAAPRTPSARMSRPWASVEPPKVEEPAPDLIVKAAYARYQPGATNPTDELILKVMAAYPMGLAIVDIAHKIAVSRQAAKGALDRLTRKGLVRAIPVKEIPYSQRQSYGASLKAVWVLTRG